MNLFTMIYSLYLVYALNFCNSAIVYCNNRNNIINATMVIVNVNSLLFQFLSVILLVQYVW